MKTMISSQPVGRARRDVVVAVGTTAIRCLKNLRTRERIAGFAIEDQAKAAGFDAKGVTHEYPLPTVNKDLQDITMEPGEIFGAVVGDLESRRLAEHKGQTWMSPPGYCEDPGIAGSEAGNGGITRKGRTLFALNEERFGDQLVSCLRQCQDYEQHAPALGQKGPERSIIRIYVVGSSAGGTATGAFTSTLAMIAAKAEALKIQVRIVPVVLLVGTLNPGDRRTVARNQQLVLRSLQAHFEGRFTPLNLRYGEFQTVCDDPVFFSNVNAFGEIASLKRLIALVGQWLHLHVHSPIGPLAYQEGINLHDQAVRDSSGDLRRAATSGLSVINVNKEKIRASVVARWLRNFFSGLLRRSDPGPGAQQAAVTFTSIGLKETATDDTAAQRLYSLHHLAHVNVQERAQAVFQQRRGNRMGFQGCTDLYRAGHFVLDQEVPHALIPKMTQEAAAVVQNGAEAVAGEISRYLKKPSGLGDSIQFLDTIGKLLETSEKANRDKLERAQQRNKELHQAKAGAEKLYHWLQKKLWLFRWLHFFVKARFRRVYPRCVRGLIRNELEVAARKLLDKRVFPGMHRALASQQERLNLVRDAVQGLHDTVCQETARLDHLPDDFYVPVGREMADVAFTERIFAQILDAEGGPPKATRRLFDTLCEKYGGLEAFGQGDPEEIATYLAEHCHNRADSTVAGLSVWDVFQTTFVTAQQQSEAVATAIGESDGRVKTAGEAHRDIPRLKYVVGPDEQTVQRIVAIANRINREGGDWRGHVDPAVTGICFLQYRAGVSITQQIRDTMKFYRLPDDPEELAQLGEDPIVALAPDTDVAEGKLDATIAQGRGCELRQAESTLVLGTLLEEIRAALAASYETRMAIYRRFCLELTQGQERLLGDIEKIIVHHATDAAKLAVSLDKATFDRVRALARSLVPYTSRMRLDLSLMREVAEKGRV